MIPGFLPQLATVLGQGAFDDSDVSTWFAGLLESNLRLGAELQQSWRLMREEVGEDVDGPLAMSAERCLPIHLLIMRACICTR